MWGGRKYCELKKRENGNNRSRDMCGFSVTRNDYGGKNKNQTTLEGK